MENRANFRRQIIPRRTTSCTNWSSVSDRSTQDSDWGSRRITKRKSLAKGFRELAFGAGDHSKCAEADGPLLACPPECGFASHDRAKRGGRADPSQGHAGDPDDRRGARRVGAGRQGRYSGLCRMTRLRSLLVVPTRKTGRGVANGNFRLAIRLSRAE
jgi:hypothetical protein